MVEQEPGLPEAGAGAVGLFDAPEKWRLHGCAWLRMASGLELGPSGRGERRPGEGQALACSWQVSKAAAGPQVSWPWLPGPPWVLWACGQSRGRLVASLVPPPVLLVGDHRLAAEVYGVSHGHLGLCPLGSWHHCSHPGSQVSRRVQRPRPHQRPLQGSPWPLSREAEPHLFLPPLQ